MLPLRKIWTLRKGLLYREESNLVEGDEIKDEGILTMANEGITLNSDMVWYLDNGASNHMCRHKHLFIDIHEIKDGHVSFGDSTKVSAKGRGKYVFPKRTKKKVLWRMFIMYLT